MVLFNEILVLYISISQFLGIECDPKDIQRCRLSVTNILVTYKSKRSNREGSYYSEGKKPEFNPGYAIYMNLDN